MLAVGIFIVFGPFLALAWGVFRQLRRRTRRWRQAVDPDRFEAAPPLPPRAAPDGGEPAGDRSPRVGPRPAGTGAIELPLPRDHDQVA